LQLENLEAANLQQRLEKLNNQVSDLKSKLITIQSKCKHKFPEEKALNYNQHGFQFSTNVIDFKEAATCLKCGYFSSIYFSPSDYD